VTLPQSTTRSHYAVTQAVGGLLSNVSGNWSEDWSVPIQCTRKSAQAALGEKHWAMLMATLTVPLKEVRGVHDGD
jgi:hypothetical protein